MKVFVYFNLHRKVFSVRALEGPNKGRVVAHRPSVHLVNAEFRVSQAGRARVIAEQRKNVHAGVVGQWDDTLPASYAGVAVTYNPYRFESFVRKSDEQPVHRAHNAYLYNQKILANIA
jgi:hypothetical protein